MAWTEVHQTLPTHKKIKKLKRLLKIRTPQAVGHMVMLWLWSIDNAPDGCLADLDPEDIAEAVDWKGDPAKLLNALAEAGFVDRGPDGPVIHDWGEYAGFLADKRTVKRQQNRERQQRYRDRAKEAEALRNAESEPEHGQGDCVTEALRNAAVTRYGDVTEALRNAPNLTLPNLTLPNQDTVEEDCNDRKGAESVTGRPRSSGSIAYFCQKISPEPSPASMAELRGFEEELGEALCVRAIDEALDNNARSWRYVKAVLRSWREEGIRSPEDLDRREADRMSRRSQTQKRPAAMAPAAEYRFADDGDWAAIRDADKLATEIRAGEGGS